MLFDEFSITDNHRFAVKTTAFVLTLQFSALSQTTRHCKLRWSRFPLLFFFPSKALLSSPIQLFFLHSSDSYKLTATSLLTFSSHFRCLLNFYLLPSSNFDFTQSLLSSWCRWHADVKTSHHHNVGLAKVDAKLQLLRGLCQGLQVLRRLFIQIMVYINCWDKKFYQVKPKYFCMCFLF